MKNALADALECYTDTHAGENPFVTAVEGLTILCSEHERPPSHLIMKPALCVVAQGAKWTLFGNRRYDYGPGQALVVSVEMPAFSRVAKASSDQPFLGVVIEFDLGVMRDVLAHLGTPPALDVATGHGVCVTDFAGPLSDCVLRMVRLLDTPNAIPVLAPMIMREICYWLLTGPHGGEVANIVLANGHAQRIVSAINTLRERYAETVRIRELAAVARMSPSAFHRRFKALTAMTPLQYQKRLRLLAARQLMVTGAANAEMAAWRVGYESPSQFSREYARMFGAPPRRDMTTW
ncbi:AraC family transcriptional regulator [Acerihabitans arboris]|uniref:AraC family transcriptional regulator n=1 Tax=Acerihabitans arboris TaxID=2691583 RepID=UPI001C49BACA|nr:AraC family transcriptional regulator [Acerihabitans arboris]